MADFTKALDPPSQIWSGNDHYLEKATATLEHGFNNLSVSGVYSCNCRAGDAKAMASSQPGSCHSLGMAIGTRKNHSMPQDLIDHFEKMEIEDPFFFYKKRVEKARGMCSFFWRDGRSMVDYEHFGDVLVLDTRTRINHSDVIIAAFWGLNHHRQRILFGCAFLVDGRVASFAWLLRSFLEAMRWQIPQTVITEVSEEIAEAISVVLPGTSHWLPYWPILNGDQPGVGSLLSEFVFDVHSQQEFESKWNALVAKYTLHENAWVASLYRMRQKWSHAFTKKVFSAGLLSIQNDEDARAVFWNLSCESMMLSQIAQRCTEVAEDMRRKEFLEDNLSCESILFQRV